MSIGTIGEMSNSNCLSVSAIIKVYIRLPSWPGVHNESTHSEFVYGFVIGHARVIGSIDYGLLVSNCL